MNLRPKAANSGRALVIYMKSPTSVNVEHGGKRSFETRHRIRKLALGGFLVGVAIVIVASLAPGLVAGLSLEPLFLLTLGAFLLVVGGLVEIAVDVSGERVTLIEEGFLQLAYRIRKVNGTRTRRVAMSEITGVVPIISESGRKGAMISLSDGTRFFLSQSSFGPGGQAVLEELSSAFGTDYSEALTTVLLEGRPHRFRVAEVRHVAGDSIILRRSIPTFAKGRLRIIRRQDIVDAAPVETAYAGTSYLIRIGDGTQFLIRKDEKARADLEQLLGPTTHNSPTNSS